MEEFLLVNLNLQIYLNISVYISFHYLFLRQTPDILTTQSRPEDNYDEILLLPRQLYLTWEVNKKNVCFLQYSKSKSYSCLISVFIFSLLVIFATPLLTVRKMASCLIRGQQLEMQLLCVRHLPQVPALPCRAFKEKLFPWKLLAFSLQVSRKEVRMLQTPLLCLASLFLLVL